jgi:uncharacterized protein YbbC (DUF1343 family)
MMRHNQTPARLFHSCLLAASLLYGVLSPVVFAAVDRAARTGAQLSRAHVELGVDVLEEENFAPLQGKRVGLITNQTGVDSRGQRTIDVLAHAGGVRVVALFSPEHGITGQLDERVDSIVDATTGLPVHSLYGETRRPTDDMLRGLDALVFDLQDAGVRFYTYITTMGYALEAAARHKISFYVFDRPNPFGGELIEGPMLDRDRLSFEGYFPMPVLYGMTLGELANMFNAEKQIGADLHVITMKNWRRNETYNSTGLAWIPPSPNLPALAALWSYPGVEILRATGLSVGRGTAKPFQMLGAPWIDGAKLVRELERRKIPGVVFASAKFTPSEDVSKGQPCEGVSIAITDWTAFRPVRMGLEIAAALQKLHPDQFKAEKMIRLLGSSSTVKRLQRGDSSSRMIAGWSGELAAFRKMRAKYLLYR